jgi:arsenate reductase
MSVTMYGIRNCDTIKRARAWLDARGVAYAFHDYKAAGIDADLLARWAGQVGWAALLNRAGTTFRKLPEAERAWVDDEAAQRLMIAQPSMIKRPVLDIDGRILVGFTPDAYRAALG